MAGYRKETIIGQIKLFSKELSNPLSNKYFLKILVYSRSYGISIQVYKHIGNIIMRPTLRVWLGVDTHLNQTIQI